jgi:hypothetical protein
MTELRAIFQAELQKLLDAARTGELLDLSDVKPAYKASRALMMGGHLEVSAIGPLMGFLAWVHFEFDCGLRARFGFKVMLFLLQNIYRDRPMWNDFRMTVWLLSREKWAVRDLYLHLARARSRPDDRHLQWHTGQWMIRSVCQQDPEFAALWEKCESKFGRIMPEGSS